MSRDQQETDEVKQNTSLVSVLKCRFTGRTGQSDSLFYDQVTGRMTKIDPHIGDEDEDF